MAITVKLFAGVAELIGENELVMSVPAVATVSSLLESLAARYPQLVGQIGSVGVAINQHYVSHSEGIRDGDEVAIIPPVSGG